MDVALHASVLKRYWYLALGGLVLAIVLAVFAVAKPSLDGGVPRLTYRDQEAWQSRSLVLLTRKGFPEGRIFGTTDSGRLGMLADLYSRLVTSDAVTARLKQSGPIDGDVSAGSIISATRTPTPLLAIYGTAATPAKSVALTERATNAFLGYLADRQKQADIRPNDRVQASIVDRIGALALVQPRKKTLPIVVFLAVLSASIALIYALEGARRRRGSDDDDADASKVESDEPLRTVPVSRDGDAAEDEAPTEVVPSRRWA